MVAMSFPQSNTFKFKCKQERFLWPKCALCGLCVPSKGFTCEKCPKDVSFTYEAQLYVHMRDVHKVQIPRIIICELCDASFSNTDDLLEHILIEKHSCFSEHLPCPKSTGNCLTLFESQDDLDEHIRSKHGKGSSAGQSIAGEYNSSGVNTNSTGSSANNNNTNFIMHTAPFVSVNLNSNYLPPQGNPPSMNAAAAAAATQNYNYMNYYTHQSRMYSNPLAHFQQQNANSQYQYGSIYNAYSVPQAAQHVATAAKYTPFAPTNTNPTHPNLTANIKNPLKPELSQSSLASTQKPAPSAVPSGDLVKDFEGIKSNRVCYLCDFSVPYSVLKDVVSNCPQCNKKFASMYDVVVHMLDYHKEMGPIPARLTNTTAFCVEKGCNMAYRSMPIHSYMDHMRMLHPYKPDNCRFHYVCEHCYQLFGSHGSLAGHHGVKGMKCAENLDNSLAELLQCQKCNHMCSPYGYTKCNFCQAKIADEREALYHIQEKHTGVVAKFKKYSKLPPFSTKCPVHFMCCKNGCRKVFAQADEMNDHQKTCSFKMEAFISEKLRSIQENAIKSMAKNDEFTGQSNDVPAVNNLVQPEQNSSVVIAEDPTPPEVIPDETSYECSVCGFLEIFEEKSLKTCKYCSSNFLGENDVAIHMAIDHESLCMLEDQQKLVCVVGDCNSSSSKVEFDTLEQFIEHRNEKHRNHSRCMIHYICLDNSCGKLFGARLLLKSHESAKLKATLDQNESSAPIFCPDCLKTCDKSEVHSCAWCQLNIAGDVEMMYHVYKEHRTNYGNVYMTRFHCNTGGCDDYFNLNDFVAHRKSKHRVCPEHYVCLKKGCDAQMFSSAKDMRDHEKKCLSKGPRSPSKGDSALTAPSAEETIAEDESPRQKKARIEDNSDSQSSKSKTASPVKEPSKTSGSSGTSSAETGNVGSTATKSWDDLMDKMLSYTNSLM